MTTEPQKNSEFPPKQHGERVTYAGSCHCKAIQYKVTHGDLRENVATECNCSICSINGYALIYIRPEDFIYETGNDDSLTQYRFNSKMNAHCFCPRCGTSVFAIAQFPGLVGLRGVNIRTLHDVDVSDIKKRKFDGKNAF
ncbi:DUF636 domain protein [Microthyrium microscopicum]|uniref:DUF636 domain protein n=1 Tax=Microthyrium microscopicum TaxID=703497 RepID=A0A6A6U0M1_9PEZI|nr:DUF636 domain protein [Microthyrium microscopicum]